MTSTGVSGSFRQPKEAEALCTECKILRPYPYRPLFEARVPSLHTTAPVPDPTG